MSETHVLRGACSCGRNHYVVHIPPHRSRSEALVTFDDSSDHGRSQAAPLTAWLRIPLAWYQSATTAFYPDETPGSIRRTFTPSHDPESQRTFCAFCGTHLSYWTEQPSSEAHYLSVTLGSLLRPDLEALEDLDLLPEEAIQPTATLDESSALVNTTQAEARASGQTSNSGTSRGLDWFEDLINGSRLGRVSRTRRGQDASRDGNVQIEWEVTEFVDDGSGSSTTFTTTSKRKLGE